MSRQVKAVISGEGHRKPWFELPGRGAIPSWPVSATCVPERTRQPLPCWEYSSCYPASCSEWRKPPSDRRHPLELIPGVLIGPDPHVKDHRGLHVPAPPLARRLPVPARSLACPKHLPLFPKPLFSFLQYVPASPHVRPECPLPNVHQFHADSSQPYCCDNQQCHRNPLPHEDYRSLIEAG